jgi:hypothetical protein
MRTFSVAAATAALISFGLGTMAGSTHAQTNNDQDKCVTKKVVSGGNSMRTYIDADQANFGNPCVVVTFGDGKDSRVNLESR